jgi:CBS domain-containing protein
MHSQGWLTLCATPTPHSHPNLPPTNPTNPNCLQYKIHRIPIVDDDRRVVGMVTRTDLFHALEV